jgi:FKBP-type peptidyl-prolyl cis-trans isomerase
MKKAPEPEAVARVVRWFLLFFLAYSLWSGAFHLFPNKIPNPNPHSTNTTVVTSKDCADQGNPLKNFSLLASSFIPFSVPVIQAEDVKQGEGAVASCGQRASLHYSYVLPSGSMVFTNLNKGKDTDAVIGGNTLFHGLELGILGMKPGGERKVAFPSVFAMGRVRNLAKLQDSDKFALKPADIQKSIIMSQVKLTGLSPDLPSSSLPLRVIERKPSIGIHTQCGDTVRVRMTLWKIDGTKLFSTEDSGGAPLVFTIGESRVPLGIEQGITGMSEGAQRTLIIPAAYAKPLIENADAAKDSPLPKLPEETLLAEVHLEHIGETAPPAPVAVAPKPEIEKKPEVTKDKAHSDKEDEPEDK